MKKELENIKTQNEELRQQVEGTGLLNQTLKQENISLKSNIHKLEGEILEIHQAFEIHKNMNNKELELNTSDHLKEKSDWE